MRGKVKKYSLIYFLYFCVFLSLGGIDKVIALYFDGMENGAVYFGFCLTAMSLVEIILPTVGNKLSERIGSKRTTYLYFSIAVITAITLYVFDFGYVLSIEYFAGRDVFLYLGVSLSLLLAGLIANSKGPKAAILILSVLLVLPCIVIKFLKLERQGTEQKEKMKDLHYARYSSIESLWLSYVSVSSAQFTEAALCLFRSSQWKSA